MLLSDIQKDTCSDKILFLSSDRHSKCCLGHIIDRLTNSRSASSPTYIVIIRKWITF